MQTAITFKEFTLAKEIRFRWWILFVVTVVGFGLDLWTKSLAVRKLILGVPVKMIGDKLGLFLIYNKAALFGLDPRHFVAWFPLNAFFTVFTIIAIFVLIGYYFYLKKSDILMHWGLALVLPGAMGNLYDRIVHPGQGVVDFIKLDLKVWPANPWPIFNLADVYVTIGVIILIFTFFLDEHRQKKVMQPSTSASRDALI